MSLPNTFKESPERSRNWIFEGDGIRLLVDFSKQFSEADLKSKRNYDLSQIQRLGLNAAICTYDDLSNQNGPLKKIAELYFLDKREGLGAPSEPVFRVEYISDAQHETAMKILNSVELY